MGVRVRSTKEVHGHSEETTPATIEWSVEAGLSTPASLYNLVESAGTLSP